MSTIDFTQGQVHWLFADLNRRYVWRGRKLRAEHDRWRKIAELQHLSRAARGRLEWIIFWEKHRKDVTLTARHFGISRKTFYQWLPRFEKDFIRGLEDRSRTPKRRRSREYTAWQYEHVLELRRQHLRYGKMKLLALYRERFPGDHTISAWKIQCIIEASGLYYEPKKQARINRKRARTRSRRKICVFRSKWGIDSV